MGMAMMRQKNQIAFTSLFLLTACSSAPSRDILGSFFPSWMLCAVIGIISSAILHKVFVKMGVDQSMPAKLFIYILLAATITFLIWLIWFGN
jgi:hypothetical protein